MTHRTLIWFVLLVPTSTGCLFSHRPSEVPISVVDAETKLPISDAHVRLSCPNPTAPRPARMPKA